MTPVLEPRPTLTLEERAEKQRLLVRDALALCSLLTIVIALTFVTYLLFHSFMAHRLNLEDRWKRRGEAALANGRPMEALESLRSALAYAPDDRTLQIELATALAAAGRTQEAVVYFNTLQEQQPGDGMINLQLARLAARQENAPLAVTHYQAALDGTWQGDGTVRRRQVRLELAGYLIARQQFDEARSQLLIAAGNASDNHPLQLTVAALLEQAEGQADALNLYRKATAFRDTRTAGLVGAGRAAAALSRYRLARNLLEQASGQPDFVHLPASERDAVHDLLVQANAILGLFPAENLAPHVRAVRVAFAARAAEARLAACSSSITATPASPGVSSPGPASGSAVTAGGERSQAAGRPGAADQKTADGKPVDGKAAKEQAYQAGSGTAKQVGGPGRAGDPQSSALQATTAGSLPTAQDVSSVHDQAVQAPASQPGAAQAPSSQAGQPGASDAGGRTGDALRSALGVVQRARETLAGGATTSASSPATPPAEAAGPGPTLASLAQRWQQMPANALLERQMERDPELLANTMHLVYDTEKTAAQACGTPSGDDDLLLKMAAAPEEIEQP